MVVELVVEPAALESGYLTCNQLWALLLRRVWRLLMYDFSSTHRRLVRSHARISANAWIKWSVKAMPLGTVAHFAPPGIWGLDVSVDGFSGQSRTRVCQHGTSWPTGGLEVMQQQQKEQKLYQTLWYGLQPAF